MPGLEATKSGLLDGGMTAVKQTQPVPSPLVGEG